MSVFRFLDCVDIVGRAPSKYDGEKVYVSTGALQTDHIDYGKTENVTFENRPSRANLVAEIGDVLFAKMQATAKTLVIDDKTQDHIFSTGFCAVRAREGILDRRCLYHIVSGEDFLRSKDQNCSGATQKAITNAGLKKIKISLPPIYEQSSIAARLDTIDTAVCQCRDILDTLDATTKSRFIEMFGSVDENPFGYEMVELQNVCRKITDGKHGGCKREDGSGYFYVGAREIYDGEIHYDTAPEITYEDFEKDYRRCNLEKGDFVIVNTGATIGKSAIAVNELTTHTLLQKSVALLKVNPEQMIPLFLRYVYEANPKLYWVESSSAQPNLLLSKIKVTKVYKPPMEKQREFISFVEAIDKSKLAVTMCMEKAQELKAALLQEYFS